MCSPIVLLESGFALQGWLIHESINRPSDEPLAQYRVTYQPNQRWLKTVTPPQLFDTPPRSPQLPLWIRRDDWLPVLRLPAYAPRRPRMTEAVQPPLFAHEEVGT